MSPREREKVRNTVQELLDNNVVRESESPYSSPVLLVKKKDGTTRMCIDYRKLNNLTVKEHYPLPRIDDKLDQLTGCSTFTILDLNSGYHQVPLSEECKHLTSFITPDGQYEYNRLPFGLANAPSVLNQTLGALRYDSVAVYIDDILIASKTEEEGLLKLRKVLEAIRTEGLTLKLSKCQFLMSKTTFLGFEISGEGIRTGEEKTKALTEFPEPKDVHSVRQFLGLASYFRQFVNRFALIAKPLNLLLHKNQPWVWNNEQKRAFGKLKEILSSRPVLSIYNPNARTEVHTDASKHGIAGVLLQEGEDHKLHPVAYFSRRTSHCEQNYHSYELETLAVVETLKKFRVYLLGQEFTVVTDCSALTTAQTKRDLVGRIARWWLQLADYNFKVSYRPGPRMAHADALSRNPPSLAENQEKTAVLHIEIADRILAAQLNDPEIRKIYEILQKQPVTEQERQTYKDYALRNGRIYRITARGIQWFVPKGMRQQILRANHDDMGHFSVDKTLRKVAENYWFPHMRDYVTRYIGNCLACLCSKEPAGRQPGYLHPIEKLAVPFHTVHVDHLGPFKETIQKNAYLIVVVEAFTKYAILKAVKSTQVKPLIELMQEVVKFYGVPTRVITDRGTAYTSKHFKEYCQEIGTQHVLNAVATPRSNGQVERYNRTILSALLASAGDDANWDKYVPRIQFALNNTVSQATGKTPSQLLLGYTPRAPTDGMLTANIAPVCKVIDDIITVREEASRKIAVDQEAQRKRYDKKRAAPKLYRVGDIIVVKKKPQADGTSKKLAIKYHGPFRVTEVLPGDRYRLEDLPGSSRRTKGNYEGVVAVDQMKPWSAPGGVSDSSQKSSRPEELFSTDDDD